MHGEYKVPGGKLVVVDLEISDGRLRAVQISGDFFLEPPDALPALDAALDGTSAGASQADLVGHLERVIGERSAALIGFDAEAIAVAVRRALA